MADGTQISSYTQSAVHHSLSSSDEAKERVGTTSQTVTDPQEVAQNLDEMIKNNPALQGIFDSIVKSTSVEGDEAKLVTMQLLIQALIDLSQALQKMATANAARLTLDSQMMSAYSTQMSQVPVATASDVTFSKDSSTNQNMLQIYNQKMGNIQQIIQNNKGLVEDDAKRVQTLLQSSQDSAQSVNDFISSFIDLWRMMPGKFASR